MSLNSLVWQGSSLLNWPKSHPVQQAFPQGPLCASLKLSTEMGIWGLDISLKLPTFVGSWRKQGSSRKTSTSASLTTLKPSTGWITTNCGRFFKRWEVMTRLPDLSPEKPLYRSRSNSKNQTWKNWLVLFQVGKRAWQSCMLSPCLFNFYAEYTMWNARLDESQAGIKLTRRNINHLRYADDTTLVAENEEELNLLMRVKEESEKSWLKIQYSRN